MQNTYNYVLFDLDGTITDPMEGITKSVQYALSKYGINVEDRRELTPFIGPPLQHSFRDFYGFTPEQANEACEKYHEYFLVKGIFENKVYEGMENFLQRLQESGRKLFVATSKPEPLARKILEHFGLISYFTFVGGDTMERSRSDKAKVISYVMETNGITSANDVIMIGDRKHDIIGAKSNNISSIGVLYGYGDYEELSQAGADFISKDLDELESLLNTKK